MAKTDEICFRCLKPKGSRSAGFVTQWISVCSCDAMDKSATDPAVELCRDCGKRISTGRKGTITQYVFRADACACKRPLGLAPVPADSPDGSQAEDTETEEEQELALDSESFPVERYAPLALLGQGAGGQVHLCRDRLLRKKVAVKTLNLLEPKAAVAFQEEARATSRLDHPGIVKVLDFGVTTSGVPYMVMDYFPGQTLAEHLRLSGPLELETALLLLVRLARALEYSHSQGVFHRDLKPENILLIDRGDGTLSTRLIDFGLAAARQDQVSTVVQGRTLVGTPSYMAPDQFNGLAFDARSEIYSLGCVFFESIAGRPPFSGETALETVMLHARQEAPLLVDALSYRCPEEVDDLYRCCLAKDPEKRFQSMGELASELDRLLYGEPPVPEVEERAQTVSPVIFVAGSLFLLACALAFTMIFHRLESPSKATLSRHIETEKTKMQSLAERRNAVFERLRDYLYSGYRSRVATDDDLKLLSGSGAKRIILDSCPITAGGLVNLDVIPLISLEVTNSNLGDEAVPYLNRLKSLSHLDLSGQRLTEAGFKAIELPRLKRLIVDDCKGFNDTALEAVIEKYPSLSSLSIAATDVTADGINQIARLKGLRSLRLSTLEVGPENIRSLSGLPVSVLDLTGCRMNAKALLELRRMRSLRSINLYSISGADDQTVGAIRQAFPPGRLQIVNSLGQKGKGLDGLSNFTELLGQE